MPGCSRGGTQQILVGLDRVGLVGLGPALEEAVRGEDQRREAVVERLLGRLRKDNYVPADREADYRLALWREYQRHRGNDIRDLYTEIEIVVRGTAGSRRQSFVEILESVFHEFELRPQVVYQEPLPGAPDPELVIENESILEGLPVYRIVRRQIQRHLSTW